MIGSDTPSAEGVDTVVVGGGIAGLSALFHISARMRAEGSGGALLLEAEPLCGTAASGRNAGIFRHLEHDEATTALAVRTQELLASVSSTPLLSATGAVYLAADSSKLDHLVLLGSKGRVPTRRVSPGEEPQVDALLEGGEAKAALLVPGDGVLDVHGLMESIRRGAVANGATIRCRAAVESVRIEEGRVLGVRLVGGEEISCRRVVIAAGAWSCALGESIGAPMPLQPIRRHLVFLQPGRPLPETGPVFWRVDEQVYARAESKGYLASPCDESSWPASVEPPVEPAVLFDLAVRLTRTLPSLADSVVQRVWACLRTFAPDRLPVVGADPRVAGLFWLGGLGGQGLSIGLAAGELLAALMRGEAHPLAPVVSPSRSFTETRSGR